MSTKVIITGDKKLISALRKFGQDGVKAIEDTVKFTALGIEDNAKQFAPVDIGTLRQSIVTEKQTALSYIVAALAHYAPYMEFGTGKKVSVPDVFREQAEQFRGGGVKEVNLRPQPFMYPAYLIAKKNYKSDLEDNLDVLIEKFNR